MNKETAEDYVQIACIILNVVATIILLIVCFPIAAVGLIYGMGKASRDA